MARSFAIRSRSFLPTKVCALQIQVRPAAAQKLILPTPRSSSDKDNIPQLDTVICNVWSFIIAHKGACFSLPWTHDCCPEIILVLAPNGPITKPRHCRTVLDFPVPVTMAVAGDIGARTVWRQPLADGYPNITSRIPSFEAQETSSPQPQTFPTLRPHSRHAAATKEDNLQTPESLACGIPERTIQDFPQFEAQSNIIGPLAGQHLHSHSQGQQQASTPRHR